MKVLMVTSEVVPFAKAGGLGDMVGALSEELQRQGHDVRVVLPRYYFVDSGRMRRSGTALGVPLGRSEEWVGVYEARLPGADVPVYFLEHEELYGRDGIYGYGSAGPSFDDNLHRFAVLSRAALELTKRLDWFPDVVHAHDWPAALAPVYLNLLEPHGALGDAASVLTVHNLAHQGDFPKEQLVHTGLGWEQYHTAGLERYGRVNLLQAGLRHADLITTVSPTYAREITTPEHGDGLDALLRHRSPDLFGVLNGVDYEIWNPEIDPLIPVAYGHADLAGKAVDKTELQRELGLETRPGVALYGMVSRLVEQKGLGELCGPAHGSLASICTDLDVQVAILGTGEAWCESELRMLAERHPNLAVRIGYDERLAHLIEAGADFFLMPSRWEPCGLNQIYSLRYGTLPIVRRTGGLADTVETYDETTGGGTGFVFDELTPSSIYNTVGWSLWAYHHRPEHIRAMRVRAMQQRFSWEVAARRYAELYGCAVDRKLGRVPRTW